MKARARIRPVRLFEYVILLNALSSVAAVGQDNAERWFDAVTDREITGQELKLTKELIEAIEKDSSKEKMSELVKAGANLNAKISHTQPAGLVDIPSPIFEIAIKNAREKTERV
jgi:hypothetical protein